MIGWSDCLALRCLGRDTHFKQCKEITLHQFERVTDKIRLEICRATLYLAVFCQRVGIQRTQKVRYELKVRST